MTRHPGAGAAEQLSVTGGEPLRNEQLSSLAAVLRLPVGNLLIRQARFRSPLSLISGGLFAVARSGQGRGAAQRTLDGEDCCEIVRERERGPLRFLSLPRGARKGMAPVSGGVLWSGAEIKCEGGRGIAPAVACPSSNIRRPGRALADCINPRYRMRAAPLAACTTRRAASDNDGLCKRQSARTGPSTCREAIKRFGGTRQRRSASDGADGCVPWFIASAHWAAGRRDTIPKPGGLAGC